MNSQNQETPAISVVIPLYNKEKEIKRAVTSALSQNLSPLEIIVVDDGSTDGGPDIVAAMNNPKIKLFRQTNAGVSVARNNGVKFARGQFIAFLDADDQWLDTHLLTIADLTRKFSQAGMFVTFHLYAEKGNSFFNDPLHIPNGLNDGLFPDFFVVSALGSLPFNTSAVVVPKTIFDQVQGFPTGVQLGEDLDLFFKIALKYPIAFSRKFCILYHLDAENRLNDTPQESSDELVIVTHALDALKHDKVPLKLKPGLLCYILRCKIYTLRHRIGLSKGKYLPVHLTRSFSEESTLKQMIILVLALLPKSAIDFCLKRTLKSFKKKYTPKTNV